MRNATSESTHPASNLVHSLARAVLDGITGRHRAKRVAAAADVSTRTAEGWVSGGHAPSLDAALALVLSDPAAWATCRAELDLIHRAVMTKRHAKEVLHAESVRHSNLLDRQAMERCRDSHDQRGAAADHRGAALAGCPVVRAAAQS